MDYVTNVPELVRAMSKLGLVVLDETDITKPKVVIQRTNKELPVPNWMFTAVQNHSFAVIEYLKTGVVP